MVRLQEIQSSNSRIASSLPSGLVAVFVGATNGIGENTVKQFAKHAQKPRVYIIGRSSQAGERIVTECKSLNADGEFIFIQADVSLLSKTDELCQEIKAKERAINLLFLSAGILDLYSETSEGLKTFLALAYFSRVKLIVNLLPLLQQASGLRRVVSVLTATKEGRVDLNDIRCEKIPMLALRAHLTSMATMSLETAAKNARDVTFVHAFPGTVKTGLNREAKGPTVAVLNAVLTVIGPLVYLPLEESGQRHLFLATSARYSASDVSVAGVPLEEGVNVARGIDGETGSGVYSVDEKGESAGQKVVDLLAQLRKDGAPEKAWEYTQDVIQKIAEAEKT